MGMVFRRRWLPHQDVEGCPVFLTACLEGSLPTAGLQRIRGYREQLEIRPKPEELSKRDWTHQKQKLLFAFVDGLLDGHSPVQHLKDDQQAKIVQDAFLHFAEERYTLLAFVVMPSHHHWLFLPNDDWAAAAVKRPPRKGDKNLTPREIISHSVQSYTATMCNRMRGDSGAYWQHETFDHWARDEEETIKIIQYIENNPVKAGLADRPEDYPWSSARLRVKQQLKMGDAISRV